MQTPRSPGPRRPVARADASLHPSPEAAPDATSLPTPLLGGLSPAQFMRRHWQKRPLLIRAAVPGAAPLLPRAALFALAADDAVESRLVVRGGPQGVRLRRGPIPRRALPPLAQAGWTLLVQGLDHHVPAAHALLARFRFVPDARLDDLMVSWASDGGGVGPHVDSYDVFLLQLEGRRRWRVSPPHATHGDDLVDGLPLKILAHFEPQHSWLLEPGDMLYLPPGWGHDGVAEGACTTASIGFRAPARDELAREILGRLIERADDPVPRLYRDPSQPATATPARMPTALQGFAADALARAVRDPLAAQAALGEALTEPKPGVWFAPAGAGVALDGGVRLDPRSRMLYDDHHVFLNGESWRAAGRDALLMRQLADRRVLDAAALRRASTAARGLLLQWLDDGWLRPVLPAGIGQDCDGRAR